MPVGKYQTKTDKENVKPTSTTPISSKINAAAAKSSDKSPGKTTTLSLDTKDSSTNKKAGAKVNGGGAAKTAATTEPGVSSTDEASAPVGDDRSRGNVDLDEAFKKRKRVIIPYVLPWENRPMIQNQKGMGAFGTGRNVKTRVDPGTKEYQVIETALKSESIIPLLSDNVNLATQKGMRIGSFRDQVTKASFGAKEFDKEKLRACEGVIPLQSGTNSSHGQSGQTPMGALRSQVPRVHFKETMSQNMEPSSKIFLSKFATPNPNCHAGTTVIDKMRKQVPEILGLPSRRRNSQQQHKGWVTSDSVLPRLQVRAGLDTAHGTGAGCHGLGAFRQVITPVTGGYNFTEEEKIASKKAQTWGTSGSLASQRGTGGFQKSRDVVGYARYKLMK